MYSTSILFKLFAPLQQYDTVLAIVGLNPKSNNNTRLPILTKIYQSPKTSGSKNLINIGNKIT